MTTYDKHLQPTPPTLSPGVTEVIPCFHDESCIHANEFKSRAWLEKGRGQILQSKSRGKLIHVSDFLVAQTGRLVLRDGDEANGVIKKDARKIIYPGAGGDPWWTCKDVIKQVSASLTDLLGRTIH